MKFSDRETKVMEKIIVAINDGRTVSTLVLNDKERRAARRIALKLKQSIVAREEPKPV